MIEVLSQSSIIENILYLITDTGFTIFPVDV